jgi:glycosyltransferase involved in cell wall biosynthesis
MRVLVVAAAYPSREHPSYGIYVRRGADALEGTGIQVERAVLHTRTRGRARTPLKYGALGLDALAHALWRRPDVVWAHFLVPTGSVARQVARLVRVPLVVTAHGTDVANAEAGGRVRAATLTVLREAAAVTAVSGALAARLRALAPGLGERLVVISAGVDTSRFHDGDREIAAAALGWNETAPRFVFVGNLVPAKNLERLLEAFARLGSGSLALVGDGPLRPRLEERARALGLKGSVRFVGEVPGTEVPRWLRAAHAACLVSEKEGFGLAAVEALACGRPVAVTRGVGAAGAVTEGATGALCDSDDVDGIAAALHLAAGLEPGRLAVGAAAPFSLARETERMAALLRRVGAGG